MYPHAIDFGKSCQEPQYVAKKILQVLFNEYRKGGELDNIYELLCDLSMLENWLNQREDKTPRYWHFSRYTTDLLPYPNPFENQLKINYPENGQVVIEFIPERKE